MGINSGWTHTSLTNSIKGLNRKNTKAAFDLLVPKRPLNINTSKADKSEKMAAIDFTKNTVYCILKLVKA